MLNANSEAELFFFLFSDLEKQNTCHSLYTVQLLVINKSLEADGSAESIDIWLSK